jgi:hypothetical protein
MSYPEPHTIEAEVDFKVEDAGKPCKTVKAHPVSYNMFSEILFFYYAIQDSSLFTSNSALDFIRCFVCRIRCVDTF